MLSMIMGGGAGSYDSLNEAFTSRGLAVNTELQRTYLSGECKDYSMGRGSISFGDDEDFRIGECPLSVLRTDETALSPAAGTVPVFVFKRVAGEGRDMPRSMYNHADNDVDRQRSYLEPNTAERGILSYLNENFEQIVVIVNAASAVELGWLSDYPHMSAVISVPSAGAFGLNSLADIFAGNINPSRRTVDTFAASIATSPASMNFGSYQYVESQGELTTYNYVSYAEGIYVGYKYYESRYEEVVLGQCRAGDFAYDEEVVFPFGYGLSYTNFTSSNFTMSWTGETGTATVTITNSGEVAGKDVVGIYL